jgi:adenylosuccinate lyase
MSTYRELCPSAGGIIHLGATSCYVTDNTELIQIREGLLLIYKRLLHVIKRLAKFAQQHRALPCLGYTHLQPAQPTTVGKRATLWCHDLLLDVAEIEHRLATLKFRGVKGTTGTQASFLQLFGGDHAKVEALDRLVAQKMGFDASYPVTGQTYSRKVDAQVLSALSGIGQSCHKAGSDLRLLQSFKELEEPFEAEQIGSSAMAYKRNPMRAEQCALSRLRFHRYECGRHGGDAVDGARWTTREPPTVAAAVVLSVMPLLLYRTSPAGWSCCHVIAAGWRPMPFMATEEILMAAVQAGGDRQELHERIRVHSQAAASEVKQQGRPNDLLQRLAGDPAFAGIDLSAALDPQRFVGRAPEQVDAFVRECVEPLLAKYAGELAEDDADVRV